MPAWDKSTYKERLARYRSWLISYMIEERPNGDRQMAVVAQGAARFEVSTETSKRYMASVTADPDFVLYRHAKRNMIRYVVREDIMAMVQRQAEAAP